MKAALLLVVLAAIGAVAATIWIGASVREETVVARPYEEGLGHDAERRAAAALGWTVELGASPAAAGQAALEFQVRDRTGAPLAGADVALTVTRPDSGRGPIAAAARPSARGYVADVTFPATGPWEIRFDVSRGRDRERLTRGLVVGGAAAGAAPACDLGAGPCALALGDAEVALELAPRPLRTMIELAVTVTVAREGAALDGAAVAVAFEMPGMAMGRNAVALAPAGAGRYAGRAVLVRCPSGRRDWVARLSVTPQGGAPLAASLPLRVAE